MAWSGRCELLQVIAVFLGCHMKNKTMKMHQDSSTITRLFKDADLEIIWIRKHWTWANVHVFTTNGHRIKSKAERRWTAARICCCTTDLVALFSTELFVCFGSGQHSEVVRLEKWARVLVAELSYSLWVLFQSLVRVYFIVLRHSSKSTSQWSWRS